MRTIATFVLAVCLNAITNTGRAATFPTLQIPDEYTHSIEQLAFYIDTHCDTDKEKIEAIYTWITHTMTYNVYPNYTPSNTPDREEHEMMETLRTRKGVCRNFARIFKRVAEEMAIPAYEVTGYNKTKTGKLMTDPHCWCAAKIGSTWYLYDPTFDMGYVRNNQFISDPKMNYCHGKGTDFIRDHMPYDPIWQLLEHPYAYQDFDLGTYQINQNAPICHYNDSIRMDSHRSSRNRLEVIHERITHNGQLNPLIEYYDKVVTHNIGVYKQREVYDIYKQAFKVYSQSTDNHDKFVEWSKDNFKGKSKEEVKGLITNIQTFASQTIAMITSIPEIPHVYASALERLKQSAENLIQTAEGNSQVVDKIFKKRR